MVSKKTIAINSLARLIHDAFEQVHTCIGDPLLESIAGYEKIEQMRTKDIESLVNILPPGYHRPEARIALRKREEDWSND